MRTRERKRAGPVPLTKPKPARRLCARGHDVSRFGKDCLQCRRDDEYAAYLELTRPRFPGGVVPIVEEIPVLSTGRVLRFPMCLPGQIPVSKRKRSRRKA